MSRHTETGTKLLASYRAATNLSAERRARALQKLQARLQTGAMPQHQLDVPVPELPKPELALHGIAWKRVSRAARILVGIALVAWLGMDAETSSPTTAPKHPTLSLQPPTTHSEAASVASARQPTVEPNKDSLTAPAHSNAAASDLQPLVAAANSGATRTRTATSNPAAASSETTRSGSGKPCPAAESGIPSPAARSSAAAEGGGASRSGSAMPCPGAASGVTSASGAAVSYGAARSSVAPRPRAATPCPAAESGLAPGSAVASSSAATERGAAPRSGSAMPCRGAVGGVTLHSGATLANPGARAGLMSPAAGGGEVERDADSGGGARGERVEVGLSSGGGLRPSDDAVALSSVGDPVPGATLSASGSAAALMRDGSAAREPIASREGIVAEDPGAAQPTLASRRSAVARARVQSLAPEQRGQQLTAAGLEQETALLEQAQAALRRGDAQRALALLAEHTWLFPKGHLSEARDVARIDALCKAGFVEQARARAKHFLAARARSPFAARVRASCLGATNPPAP